MRACVVAEPSAGDPTPATLEAVAAVMATGEPKELVVIHAGPGRPDYGVYGATRSLVFDPPWDADADPVADLAAAIGAQAPDLVVWPPGRWGLEVGTRVAVRLGAGFVASGRALAADERGWVVHKDIHGGKAVAALRPVGAMAMVQLVSGAVAPATVTAPGGAPWSVHPRLPHDSPMHVERRAPRTAEGVDLASARRIVSGGRGLGGPEGFTSLAALADVIGAAVGASRAAVDAGWVLPQRQVGQTGTQVSAELYLAVGISGASQHLAGITRVRHVVAINRDPKAAIFQRAELGVVDEWREVIAALVHVLKAHGVDR